MTLQAMLKVVEENQERMRFFTEEHLKFWCHPEIPCFTTCCADLHLVLSPYDILRMKRRLQLPSGEFIKQYTEPHDGSESIFPLMRLKMRDDEGRPCPLVSPKGCTIYEDRPGACRLYPLGRAAAGGVPGNGEQSFYFVVNESHCLGFTEGKEYTLEEWIQDQGVRLYNEMNRPWVEIVTSKNPRLRELTEQKLGMFHMASYNLDRFRDFVFQTKFFKVFDVSPGEIEKVASDEVELMKLGMRWLRFALFGEGDLVPR